MPVKKPQVLLLLCKNCRGMTAKLLPEIMLNFSESLRVLPVTCPSEIDPFAFIKLLKNSVDGIAIACPQDTCCCPQNKKVMKRREIVKDIMPVFGLHGEQFQIASVSPFGGEELTQIIQQMLRFIKINSSNVEEYKYFNHENDVTDPYKWVN